MSAVYRAGHIFILLAVAAAQMPWLSCHGRPSCAPVVAVLHPSSHAQNADGRHRHGPQHHRGHHHHHGPAGPQDPDPDHGPAEHEITFFALLAPDVAPLTAAPAPTAPHAALLADATEVAERVSPADPRLDLARAPPGPPGCLVGVRMLL